MNALIKLFHANFGAAIFLIVAASSILIWHARDGSQGLVITAIDVGQADSLLIQTPRGHAFLIDGGGRLERSSSLTSSSAAEDIGERVVIPFLIRKGIHHLDAVLLSHGHGDHLGGQRNGPPIMRLTFERCSTSC
ncbi:MAG: MBL fold metallo-hydrolase [Candidatus Eremiobacteraeota bacterium]|nr:MBL fold metallo-hydrolase [Candidatus Eremiobacteraeota bacterium]